jgi:hypothetical protein
LAASRDRPEGDTVSGVRHFSDRAAWLFTLGLAATIAVAAAAWLPASEPLPGYLQGARELLATGQIVDHHSPGYMLLLALAITVSGTHGILILHGILFVLVCATALRILRALELPPAICALGVLPVALHPTLVINITRISDNNISVLLLLCFVWMLLWVRKRGLGWRGVAAGGLLCGAILLIRPNLLTVVAAGVVATWRHDGRLWPAISRWIAIVAIAAIGALVTTYWCRGVWQLSDPFYAAYTFHNGTNPRAARAFLYETTGEYSTFAALKDEGIHDLYALSKDEGRRVLLRSSWRFIREHPLDYAALLVVKGFNFFRPDYRRVNTGDFGPWLIVGGMQSVMALPVVVWLALKWRTRHLVRWDEGLYASLLLPLYVLPFVALYAEPRYRWPVDILLLLESAFLLTRARQHGLEQMQGQDRFRQRAL